MSNYSKLSLRSLGFVALLLTSSAALAQEQGGTVVITTTPEPSTITNALSSAPTTAEVATKIFDGLLEYDMDLNPLPSLAESWEISDDGLQITFKLREGVVWHDGEPFTSADVQFSLMEVVREYHPRGKGNLGPLTSVDTPDDLTVVLNLEHPYVPLMRGLSSMEAPIVPKHIYEGTDFRNNPAVNEPIGTGPFRFAEWNRGSHLRLERNENYWRDGRPYLDNLIFRFIADSATRAAGVESGEIDVATFGTINPVEMRRLEGIDGISIAYGGYEAVAPVMLLELNNAKEPFDDKRVRQAVAYALDRQRIIDTVWYGFGKPAVGPISSFVAGSGAFTDEGVLDFTVEDRIEIAERLLDEAGYPVGDDGYRFTITHDPAAFGEDWRRMGEVIRQQLAQVNINVELRNRDYPTYVREVHNNYNFDMTSSWYVGMADPTLGVQRNTWSQMINAEVPFGNVAQYSNPRVDELWESAQTEADPEIRNQHFHELQRILVEDSPLIWIMDMDLVAVQNDRVRDLITSPLGIRGGLYDTWVAD